MARSTAALLIAFLVAPTAYAEPPAAPIRTSIERMRFDQVPAPSRSAAQQLIFQQRKPISSATKATVAFVGGFAGFFGGGLLGAALEPNCRCDDPGLKGFMIGAPIGAVLGAIGALKLVQ